MDLKSSKLRKLDIDDLLILANMGKNKTNTYSANILKISLCAIAHRLRRYPEIFPGFEAKHRHGKNKLLNDVAQDVCRRADQTLNKLMELINDARNLSEKH